LFPFAHLHFLISAFLRTSDLLNIGEISHIPVMMSDTQPESNSTAVILYLLFLLIALVLLLFYLYKRLNRDTDGQYTIQHLIFSPGGLRDRVIQGVQAVESRVHDLRSRLQIPDEEEGNAENDEVGNGERKQEEAEKGRTQNDTNGEIKEEQNQDNSSDDYSSIDLRERVKENNNKKVDNKEEDKKEESEDRAKENDCKQSEEVKNEERVGLFIDLKSFSGSAIWSGEKGENNMTVL
ncbi:hypothetical protein P4O66_008357, partial [Electrophorus voltai]